MEKIINFELLSKIKNPDDLKKLNKQEILKIKQEIYDKLIELAKSHRIHLGSNLGIIELTIALLLEINHDETKLFYDTGHQCYVHKMLTGRFDSIDKIRLEGGISGFPCHSESVYDFLSTGHSSTSLSICQGYNETGNNQCIPIIGDASINNGLALEALNDIAFKKNKMIIIVNDNDQSISKSVGFLYHAMSKIKNFSLFFFFERTFQWLTRRWKWSRKLFYKSLKFYNRVESTIFGKNIFQSLGFMYVGKINGHNIKRIRLAYQKAKFYSQYGPVILHIKTIKSNGYLENKNNNHSCFLKNENDYNYSNLMADELKKHISNNKNIFIINSAMTIPCKCEAIERDFPCQYQDVGINEEHAITKASGMALNNKKVIVPMYSTFLQRTYDQIHHDIARINLPVLFLIERADIASSDGDTHHGIYDVGMIKSIPNTIITSPSNDQEMKLLIKMGIENQFNPFFIRYGNYSLDISKEKIEFKFGEWIFKNQIKSEIVIITYGNYVNKIFDYFKNDVDIINAIFITKFNEEDVIKMLKKYKHIIFYERIFHTGTLFRDISEIFFRKQILGINLHSFAFFKNQIGHGQLEAIDKREKMDLDSVSILIKKIKSI